MAIVQSPDSKEIEESKEKPKYKVTPRYSAWLKEGKFHLEIALPGVKKDAIKIKALEDYFTLRADRENITYALDLDLSFKIEPDKVSSKYGEGLLKVEFERFDPLKHAHAVLSRDHKEDEKYHKVYPSIYRNMNYGNKTVQVELALPGVKKEDIEFKVRPTWFHLSAVRTDDEIEYTANERFGVEIIPEKTEAEYFEGLLKITAKVRDPLDSAKEIKF